MMSTLKGTVIRSTGSWNTVLLENGSAVECRLRGQFRIKGLRTTNPITVGDHVEITIDRTKDDTGIIEKIHERKNYVIRKSVNLSKQAHIIASNLDQALIIATVEQPRTSFGFIDRLLCTTEAYGINSAVLINKIDLYHSKKSKDMLEDYLNTYNQIGYKTFATSATTGEGITALKNWMKDKVTLISGHSGVGKSTVINALQPKLDLKTGEISEVHQKGQHTTTFAEMFPLEEGGYIIDTPGLKEFGMIDMTPEEVSHYFPEIFNASDSCKFNNCTHINEPGCNVKLSIEEGSIPKTRYTSYLSIVESIA